jgi:DNA-binding GntR family transcriptional regulator
MCAMAVATSNRTARVANSSVVAADLIREAILDGELPAGTRLKEDELATRLDVSRTPVREALRRLEVEGLVVHEPKRGAAVRAYSAGELDDMYRLRSMLEGYAARRAAERMTPDVVEQLRGSCRRFERLTARKRVPIRDLARENMIFHECVLLAAGDERLADMVRSVIHLPLVYRAYVWFTDEEKRASASYHERLVDILAAGDADGAARLMEEHVLRAREGLARALHESGG